MIAYYFVHQNKLFVFFCYCLKIMPTRLSQSIHHISGIFQLNQAICLLFQNHMSNSYALKNTIQNLLLEKKKSNKKSIFYVSRVTRFLDNLNNTYSI